VNFKRILTCEQRQILSQKLFQTAHLRDATIGHIEPQAHKLNGPSTWQTLDMCTHLLIQEGTTYAASAFGNVGRDSMLHADEDAAS
jgi:hypothetical protein